MSIEPENKTVKNNKIKFLIKFSIRLVNKRKYARAMTINNETLSIIEDKTSDEYASALAIKSLICYKANDLDNALKYCDESLKIFPDDSIAEMKQVILNRMNSI